ncbi:MAG: hypothetical protein LC776_12065 [Acidobacteria bacterium]|nr:hypothetical protein [Acidobacteriota bacterium]
MKRMIQGLLTVSFLVVLSAPPVRADVTKVSGGLGCGANADRIAECNPTQPIRIRQGTITLVRVKGQDLTAMGNTVDVSGSGITARKITAHTIAPGEGFGTDQLDLELTVPTNAAAGERTVTVNHNICLGCPKKYKFKILVVHFGKVTGVSGTEPNDFFQEVTLTFTGERLGDAGVRVVPPSTSSSIGGSQIPQVITTPNPDGTTAEILNNTETSIQVKLRFPELRAETTQRLQFFDKNCDCSVYQGLNNNVLFSTVTIRAKDNFIDAIEFPNGNSVRVGSLLTIRIKLARPVRSATTRPGVIITAIKPGEPFRWQLVPSTVFEAAPGSGTLFNPTGLNSVTIPPGNDSVTLTVRLKQVPSGCPEQGCTGQIQTRINNFNSDQPPFFKSVQFTILPGN